MKVLIYGIGVLGSTLLHTLCKAGHDVTGVARSQFEQFVKDGIIIRHYFQHKTTVDRPKLVKAVNPDEHYDVVFSVMQATQQKGVLDALASVNAPLVILVGNNLESESMEQYILEHAASPRHVLFAFQDSGGHRKDGKFIVGRLPITPFHVGKLHGPLDEKDKLTLQNLFAKTSYRLKWIDDMVGYYWCHVAEVMPYAYLCYKLHYQLKKATRADIRQIVEASHEAFEFLEKTGIPIMPVNENQFYCPGLKCKMMSALYWIAAKTIIGEIFIAGHCRYAPNEMKYLDLMFDNYRHSHDNHSLPAWDNLRKDFLTFMNDTSDE